MTFKTSSSVSQRNHGFVTKLNVGQPQNFRYNTPKGWYSVHESRLKMELLVLHIYGTLVQSLVKATWSLYRWLPYMGGGAQQSHHSLGPCA